MLERVIITGFGGQGIIFTGKLLAQAMMDEGHNVTYFPAYGPEVRGGRANCHVIISSDEIFSPVIAQPDTLIAMNQISWDYFAASLRPEGLAVVNSTMVAVEAAAAPGRLIRVPAADIANELGDVRVTNMVMFGAYNHARSLLPLDRLLEHIRSALGSGKAALYELNCQAVRRGVEAAAAAIAAAP